jgi:hypothetical protein
VNYFIARDGKTFGPYSPELVQRYLGEGSIRQTDMAQTEGSTEWAPLGQLLGLPPAHAQNVPPSLHWAIVLLLNVVTGGLFVFIWNFVQSSWIKTIDPSSTATRDYVLGIVLACLGGISFCSFVLATVGVTAFENNEITPVVMGTVGTGLLILCAFLFAGAYFHWKAIFGIRASMVRYYNTVEPINLRLSAIMTFFFNVFYFQYHFSRIAVWKQTGYLSPQR